jgi:hypothetical protein
MSKAKRRRAAWLVVTAALVFLLSIAFSLPGQDVAGEVYAPAVADDVYASPEFVPDAPTGLTATNPGTGREVFLHWDEAGEGSDVLGYLVYRAMEDGGYFARVGNDTVDTHVPSYTDTNVERNETYWYRVSAVTGAGVVSSPSNTVSVSVYDSSPPAVADLYILEPDSGHELKLLWSDSGENDVAEYRVYRAADGEEEFREIAVLGGTATEFNDSGLTRGQQYFYFITAADTSGNESGESAVVSAVPRKAVRITVDGGEAAVTPDDVHITADSNAVFLGVPNDSIRLDVVLLHGEGSRLPVAGTWRFASDFGEFRRLRAGDAGAASAHFYAEETGEGEIVVEFYPSGWLKPSASSSLPVRALDWYLLFTEPDALTATAGSKSLTFTAEIKDEEGLPVTDPAARVRFVTTQSKKGTGNRRNQTGLAARPADSLLTVVYYERKLGVNYGSPDETGRVSAVFEAGSFPGREAVQAELVYDDGSWMAAYPKVLAVSKTVSVDVVPGDASFLAWEPAECQLSGMSPVSAAYNWYDGYGNRTAAPGGQAVFVQVPERLPFEIQAAGEWIGPGEWLELAPGQKLHIRAASGAEQIRAGTYVVNTKVTGMEAPPPMGLGQANRPLVVIVGEDIVLPTEKSSWLREIGAKLGSAAAGLLLWFRQLFSHAAGGVSA